MKKMKLFALVAIASMATVALLSSNAFAGGPTTMKTLSGTTVSERTTKHCGYKDGWRRCKKTTQNVSYCISEDCD